MSMESSAEAMRLGPLSARTIPDMTVTTRERSSRETRAAMPREPSSSAISSSMIVLAQASLILSG